MSLPIIAITMGDAAGIGPEIIMKALALPEVRGLCNPLVVGDAERLRRAGEIVSSRLHIESLDDPAEARQERSESRCERGRHQDRPGSIRRPATSRS